MINAEWLCSSFKLCDIVDVSQYVHTDNSTQVEINRNSFPQPAYNPSSVKVTLEAYSLLLEAAFEQNMKHTDQKVIEHQYAQTDSIHHFAQKTANTIIELAMTKGETPSSEHSENKRNLIDPRQSSEMRGNDVNMLAEELTLQACCKALEEMGRHCVLMPDDTSDKQVMEGACVTSGHNCDEDMDIKMEEYDYKFATTLKSMVSLGSIEYPDAPPSTPLHPEMLKSRDSFTRKLKGGLAKEFLPSTPPSTPKDQIQPLLENQMTGGPGDKSEFMTRLMRSLSLECRWQGGLEEEKAGDDGGLQDELPKLADYAAQLSADILNFITTNDVEVNKEVWATAEELADEIVIASLAEVIMKEKEESRREQNGLKSVAPQLSTACVAAEDIKILASDLIINAVVHAFAKLKQGGLKHQHLSSQATEQQPWEKEIYSCKGSTPSNKASTIICRNDTLELNGIAFDAMNMTSSVHTYANKFAQDVLENSVRDASCIQINLRQGTHVQIGSQKDIIPLVIIKMYSEVSSDVQELQCALLWAAASQTGTSELFFDLPDTSITKQLCRLSRSARLNGWTVGALVASLCQYCDMQEEASRWHHKSSDSLLGHLHQLIDNTPLN
nr:uncharacterized protein si:dkey-171c9.3 [Misgurnus anguillicaudatus]